LKVIKGENEDQYVRLSALSSLGKIIENIEPEILIGLLDYRNSMIRKEATRCLGVLKDNIRLEVVKALGTFKDELAVKHLMMIIKNRNEDTQVRSEAVMAMSQMENEKVVETLINLIQPLS
jgi:HEAT repeat protein